MMIWVGMIDSGWAKLLKPINNYIHRKRQNTLTGSKENILAHYEFMNDRHYCFKLIKNEINIEPQNES